MLSKVKLALRISHTLLDNDIEDTIATAKEEMVRAGIDREVAESDNSLIEMAIKTYCQYIYANDVKKAEGYLQSWSYQLDNIRKSSLGGGANV